MTGGGGRATVVVSNRGPLAFQAGGDGRPVPAEPGGGLAATLHPLLAGSGATWVAAPLSEADRDAARAGLMTAEDLSVVLVPTEPDRYRLAYDVVSNATLWFCHHHLFDLPRRPRFDHRWDDAWAAYREVNAAFATTVAEVAPEGAAVLVQDYHLCLVGALLARSRPDLATVHFSHTPFADPNVLRTLPARSAAEMLAGMAGFGSCGFHARRWADAFGACMADPGLAAAGGATGTGRGAPPVFVAPLGPDVETLRREADAAGCAAAAGELEDLVGDRQLVVRVDRVELSKNLLRGFWAFEELLETRPRWRGRVVFLALAYPSREALAEYVAYRSEVEHTVDRINERWGTADWTPIVLDVADDRHRSMAALLRYDVLLVNPVRDGLNLVAKEGPAVNRHDGQVVLSREAGAWEELHPAALGVNPFDLADTAAALHTALAMAPGERAARAAALRELATGRTAAHWLADQLARAGAVPHP